MNDRDILISLKSNPPDEERKYLENILWVRYQRLIHKNWGILKRQMNNSSQILAKEDDYFSDAYIAMKKCITAIDISKIENDNWKFVGYYRFYLRNVRSHIITTINKEYHNECSLTIESDDQREVSLVDLMVSHSKELANQNDPAEIVVHTEEQRVCDLAVASCMQSWNDIRRQIFSLREEGIPKKKIADRLQVHPATVTYYMKGMRADIEKALLHYK
jgi:hypothetical protein